MIGGNLCKDARLPHPKRRFRTAKLLACLNYVSQSATARCGGKPGGFFGWEAASAHDDSSCSRRLRVVSGGAITRRCSGEGSWGRKRRGSGGREVRARLVKSRLRLAELSRVCPPATARHGHRSRQAAVRFAPLFTGAVRRSTERRCAHGLPG